VSLGATMKQRCLIIMLLIICGDVQPNPGPVDIDSKIFNILSDFKNMSELGAIQLNIQSMLPKTDSLRIWAKSTNADIIILSETWLSKSVTNKDIVISGHNVFRTDRPRKAGGEAIYVKSKFNANVLLSICE